MLLEKLKEEAYINYYHLVISELYCRLDCLPTAEDLAHDIFITLNHKIDSVTNVRKWLLAAVKNSLRNHYRAKDKEKYLTLDEAIEEPGLIYVNGFHDSRIILDEIAKKILDTEEERIIYEMIALCSQSIRTTAGVLNLTKHRVEYVYNQITRKILLELKSRGIRSLEDLL